MTRATIIVLDDGGPDWAGEVVGELLGRPGFDLTILSMRAGELSEGSTGRLWWQNLQPPWLLVTRQPIGEVSRWLDGEGITRPLTPADQCDRSVATGCLAGHDPAAIPTAIERWQRRVTPDPLDQLVDRLDESL